MSPVYLDRVQENFTTTGTGTITVAGTVAGYRGWATLNDNDVAPYCAVDPATGAWEVGTALVTKAAPATGTVTVLAHFDGANAATTFTNDTSMASPPALTAIGTGPQLTTTTTKFGATCLDVPPAIIGGTTQAAAGLLIAAHSANDIGLQDFTVEMWVKFKGVGVGGCVFFDYENSAYTAASLGFTLLEDADGLGRPYLAIYAAGNSYLRASPNLTVDGLWHAVAISRVGLVMRTFFDGVLQDSIDQNVYTSHRSYDQSRAQGISLGCGRFSSGTNTNANAYIDEFRFTVGYGQYTANYSPATAAFAAGATAPPVTLARTPTASSNLNALVNFAAGTKQVFLTVPAAFFAGNGLTVDGNSNITLGKTGGVATAAVDGYAYIPSCAGVPTGVPTSKTGFVPLVWDRTNKKLYVYDAGWNAMN